MDLASLEGIAAEVLAETGCDDPPVDAFELAELVGLTVVHERLCGGGQGRLSGRTVYVDTRARDVRQHGVVAHETAHYLLGRAREDNTEPAARYLSGALMLPRRAFEADLRGTWDPIALRARHVNASVEMVARRIVALRDAVASIWDDGRLRARVVSPWLQGFGDERPSGFELELARHVLDSGRAEQVDSCIWAVPVFSPGWRRVVVVAAAEQLGLRL